MRLKCLLKRLLIVAMFCCMITIPTDVANATGTIREVSTVAQLQSALTDATVDVVVITQNINVPNETTNSLSGTAVLTANHSLTLKSKEGNIFTLKRTGNGTAEKYKSILEVYGNGTYDGYTVNIRNIIFDGGAVWSSGNPGVRTNSGISGRSIIDVANKATLNIEDGVTIQNGYCTNSVSTRVPSQSKTSQCYGGGVRVEYDDVTGGGTINLKSGSKIINCEADDGTGNDGYGGAIGCYNYAKLNVYGGTIDNCFSAHGGAIGCTWREGTDHWTTGVYKMYGGKIQNCYAVKGGALFADGVTKADVSGAGISEITGGEIKNNVASSNGGAIVVEETTELKIATQGLTITGNSPTATDFSSYQSISKASGAKITSIGTYKVTFNTNGGSTFADLYVMSGNSLGEAFPGSPTKGGYTFDGWYAGDTFATSFTKDTTITSDVTVYAKWIENLPEVIPGYYPLTVSNGFNKDVIAETGTNATFIDGDNADAKFAYYSKSANPPSGVGGLPNNGLIENDIVKFQLNSYTTNNALQIDTIDGQYYTLTLDSASQGKFDQIAILCCSGNNDTHFEAKVNYSDGASISQTFYSPDWMYKNECASGDLGRVKLTTGAITTNGFGMYNRVIGTDPTKIVESVSFKLTSKDSNNGRANIFAISGVINAATVPVKASTPTISGIGNNNFTVNWTKNNDADNYYVEIATDSSFNNFVAGYGVGGCMVVGNTSKAVTGLAQGTQYYVRVKAANSVGVGPASNSANATTNSPKILVSNLAIQLTTPSIGATPVTSIDVHAQYTGTVTWTPAVNTFAGRTKYIATITLTGKGNNRFYIDDSDKIGVNAFTVNGIIATNAVATSTSPNQITVVAEFAIAAGNDPAKKAVGISSGYNADVIAENTSGLPKNYANQAIDMTGARNQNYAVYSKAYASGHSIDGGLPNNGLVTSTASNGYVYQLANYAGNNALRLTGKQSGTLTLANPGSYNTVSVLATSANGSSRFTATLNFSDGSTQSATFFVSDWFGAGASAIESIGRVERFSGSVEGLRAGQVKLFDCVINVADENQTKVLNSVTVSKYQSAGLSGSASSIASIFAISAEKVSGTPNAPFKKPAESISDTGFIAKWEDISNATGYYIDVATESTFSAHSMVGSYNNKELSTSDYSVSDGVCSYPVTGLVSGTKYYYRVRAINVNGSGFSSEATEVETTGERPLAPTDKEDKPEAVLDGTNKEFTNLIPNEKYLINGVLRIADGNGKIKPIDDSWYDETINIIKIGDGITKLDSEPQALVLLAKPLLPAPSVTVANIDYINEKLTGINKGTEYIITCGSVSYSLRNDSNEEITLSGIDLTNAEYDFIGKTIKIEEVGSNSTEIIIPRRSRVPSLNFEKEIDDTYKITGLNNLKSYEYKGADWSDVPATATEITGQAIGTYDVREKATDSSFKSEVATVVITAMSNGGGSDSSKTLGNLPSDETERENKLNEIFGDENWEITNVPNPNTIKILNNITIEDPIIVDDDVTLDLGGKIIKSKDNKPVIKIKNDNVDIVIVDSVGGGKIIGGNGVNGEIGEDGTDGSSAIDFGTHGGTLTIGSATGKVTIIGGNGGNGGNGTTGTASHINGGNGGAGGKGADAIKGGLVNVTVVNGEIFGGHGGIGGAAGEKYNSTGDDGNGGNGGDGGNGVKTDGNLEITSPSISDGGDGGDGGSPNGDGGNGGNGAEIKGDFTGDEEEINGGDGGDNGEGEEDGEKGNGYINDYPHGGDINFSEKTDSDERLHDDEEMLDRVFGNDNWEWVYPVNPYDTDYLPPAIRILEDITPDEPINIEENIEIDLNNHDIIGPKGKENDDPTTPDEDERDGKEAIIISGTNIDVVIVGPGNIIGGDGDDSNDGDENGGNGGNAIIISGPHNNIEIVGPGVDIKGGPGGDDPDGPGGQGGDAINISGDDNILDFGPEVIIEGGPGGGGKPGGPGGDAVDSKEGDGTEIDVGEDVDIKGGPGGPGKPGEESVEDDGGDGGNGGNAIEGEYVDVIIIGPGSDIIGGPGGDGDDDDGNGGNGGIAIETRGDIIIERKTPRNNIIGGDGGDGGENGGDGGDSGPAIDGIADKITDKNVPTVIQPGDKGNGGEGEPNGEAGDVKESIIPKPKKEVKLPLPERYTDENGIDDEDGSKDDLTEELDFVFGEGNWEYNSPTIRLIDDIILDEPIIINNDSVPNTDQEIVIDLNGHTIKSPKDEPAIIIEGDKIDITIVGPGTIEGHDGTPGSDAILIEGNDIKLDVNGDPDPDSIPNGNTIIRGGDGEDSDENGGDGGDAIKINGNNIDININNPDVIIDGGDGGDGGDGKPGGDGGDAIDNSGNNVDIYSTGSNSITGGDGGDGIPDDEGGDGGNAIKSSTRDIKFEKDDDPDTIIEGGNGGEGVPNGEDGEDLVIPSYRRSSSTKPEAEEKIVVGDKNITAYEKEIVDDDNGNKITQFIINEETLEKEIINAPNGSSVISAVNNDDGVNIALKVKNIEDMASKKMVLTVSNNNASYEIQTDAINTDEILSELGARNSKDVPISVVIAPAPLTESQKAENVIISSGAEVIVKPMEFTITASYNGKVITVNKFKSYVERVIEVTEKQAKKITTAIVNEKDGTIRHIPTYVYGKNNKWYAKINSRTNSIYTLIYNEQKFDDAKGRWYEDTVNEMASRKIISGRDNGNFDGGASITRAEFTSIIVKALGLPSNGKSNFTDVNSKDWWYDSIGTATEYGLVSGYEDGSFRPRNNISRQEAMAIMQRVSKVAEYTGSIGNLDDFFDVSDVSAWAENAVKFNVGSKLIVGNNGKLLPKDNITRAESATVILKLLQKSELVDIRTKL